MSMIPIPQETFRSARTPAPRNTFEAGYPAKPWAPLAILITSLTLWSCIGAAIAAAKGWL